MPAIPPQFLDLASKYIPTKVVILLVVVLILISIFIALIYSAIQFSKLGRKGKVVCLGVFFILIFGVKYCWHTDSLPQKSVVAEETKKDIRVTEKEQIMPDSGSVLGDVSDCLSNGRYKNFDDSGWTGFQNFNINAGVYSPKSRDLKVDAQLISIPPCNGNFVWEVSFIPWVEELIDLNLYYGGYYRWEIGGLDARSLRLYKNEDGCEPTTIKNAVRLATVNRYLNEPIKIGRPVTVYFYLFTLNSGLVRAEVRLMYLSAKTGDIVTTPKGRYFFDFEVNDDCGLDQISNIETNKERLSLSLMPAATDSGGIKKEDLPLPRVEPQRYRIAPFNFDDYQNGGLFPKINEESVQ